MSERNLSLRHATPAFRTFCGKDACSALPRELARLGAERAVIVCPDIFAGHPTAMNHLHQALGDKLIGQFEAVVEHSPLPTVEAARAFLAQHNADAVIAVGGGSSVVTARAASILLAEGRDAADLCTRRQADGTMVSPRLNAPKLPQWVVASTPTTAYAKAGSAVRDEATGARLALYDPKTRAQGIIVDPVFAQTAPPTLVWSATLNVFSVAVEGLQSPKVDPLADALLAHALRTVITWLPRAQADPDATEPRLYLMLAALMSGEGSDHTGGGLAQALSHAVGPRSAVANGVIEALMLPHVARFNTEVVEDRLLAISDLLSLSATDRTAAGAVAEIERLLAGFGVPTRLSDTGVPEAALTEAADHAMDDWAITTTPRAPDRGEVMRLLEAAW